MTVLIAPSVLAADFAHLADEIRRVEDGGADLIHVDVMDGHFVPNLTLGIPIVEALRRVTKLPLDVHLMIENPDRYVAAFARAGASVIAVHAEACPCLDETLARVRDRQRPRYGYYVDHVIDLAGTAALLTGMGASGLMQPSIAIAVLAAYLLVSAETYLATHSVGIFRLSCAGVGPTELRILIASGGFYVAAHPWVDIAGRQVRLLDVSGVIAAAGLVLVFMASAIRNTRALYLAERLP